LETHQKGTNVVKSTFVPFYENYCLYSFLCKAYKHSYDRTFRDFSKCVIWIKPVYRDNLLSLISAFFYRSYTSITGAIVEKQFSTIGRDSRWNKKINALLEETDWENRL